MLNSNDAPSGAAAFLALSCVGFIASALPTAAVAQTAPGKGGQPVVLDGTTVTDTAISQDVKADRAESPKYTAPILDTPQTITVITAQTLQQQNLLSLKDALSTIPGITFGAGEGGGGYGDSINLRGYSANTDIEIDGVRDSAQYSRSDVFDIEQIEVVNGANSVFGGSGSIGGTINLISKRPKDVTLTTVLGGVGTDDYFRGTIDSNVRLGNVAVRLNAMAHRNDIPGNDVERARRWGVAPAITLGIDTPTRLTALYFHQEDRNTPIYGVPYYNNGIYQDLLPGEKYSGYYGYRNVDRQDQTIDQATIIVEHDVTDTISIRNLSRWQDVKQNTVVDQPQGAFCLDNGLTPTGAACPAGQARDTLVPNRSGTTRLTKTGIFYEQLDLRLGFTIAGMENNMTIGGSLSQEDYKIANGVSLRNPNGATPNPVLDVISISNPNAIYTGPVNYVRTGDSVGDTFDKATYLFDTLKLTRTIELNGGIRYEGSRNILRTDTQGSTPATLGTYTRGADQKSDANLFSYRAGLVFKPTKAASLYIAYGNSKTPVSSSVRTGCGTVSAQTIGIDPCSAAPQQAVSYEVGGKIEVLHEKLLLTAAVFRNDRTNYPVPSNDPLLGTVQVNDGRSRVDGVVLGATGRITRAWTIFANYTYLKSKVFQSISNYCLAHLGATYTPAGGTAITCPTADLQAGNPLTATPRNSGSLFTTYTLPFGLQLGYGFTYVGGYLLNNAAPPLFSARDYLTHRLLVSYPIAGHLTAQVNVQNLTDRKYFTAIRNNGWATPGEARSAVFSMAYSF